MTDLTLTLLPSRSRAVPLVGRDAGLDALRGIAALGVVLFHLCWASHLVDPAMPTFTPGSYGVQLFFVISGYVILMTARRSPGRAAFVRARALRLYPAFLVCLLITTAWVYLLGLDYWKLTPGQWLANLTMVPGLLGQPAVDGVYWTLRYEVCFYAAVALLLPLARSGRALHLAGLFVLALPALPPGLAPCAFFAVGIAIHERLARPVLSAAVAAAAVLTSHDVCWSATAALLVLAAIYLPLPGRVSAWAGAVSYPLYLLHDHVGCTLVVALRGLGSWPALVLSVLAVVLAATAVVYYAERPLSAWLKRVLVRN